METNQSFLGDDAVESRRSGLRWALGSMAKPVPPDAAFGEVWRNISEMLRVVLASAASAKLSDVQQFQELISLRPRRATGIGTGDRFIRSCRPLGRRMAYRRVKINPDEPELAAVRH